MSNSLSEITSVSGRRTARLAGLCLMLLLGGSDVHRIFAEDVNISSRMEEKRCVVLEFYVRNGCADCPEVAKKLEEFANKRPGVRIQKYNLDEPGKQGERFLQILKYFQLEDAEVPAIYGCNSLLLKLKPDQSTDRRLDALLTLSVYVRSGCPKCARAKQFLAKLKPRYPAFEIKLHELVNDANARDQVQKLARRYGKQAVSVPVFYFCNQLMVGWLSEESTGRQLQTKLKYWTESCSQERSNLKNNNQGSRSRQTSSRHPAVRGISSLLDALRLAVEAPLFLISALGEDVDSGSENDPQAEREPVSPPPSGEVFDGPVGDEAFGDPLAPIPGDGPLGLPPPIGGPPPVDGEQRPPPEERSGDRIDVPLLGELSQSRLGMPAFTFLIGLVDGFNPCAMWVLLFLLSVLVNLRSRAKILAVAGTFVLISGLAYFAFMAAWLNVFLLIGYLPKVQLTLGIFAVLIGAIHVKDFFAFKKGLSLSIPESVKPGIYARVRKIVTAENLGGAIAGATILAVMVNIIELLCTAGLPALYTEILTMQDYPTWKYYAYLGLYIAAYMFDDALMVACVVFTLGRHKLQEREGRWLKLASGIIILALGLVMIFKPSLLV